MVGVLITGHGNFATGLKTSVELIAVHLIILNM